MGSFIKRIQMCQRYRMFISGAFLFAVGMTFMLGGLVTWRGSWKNPVEICSLENADQYVGKVVRVKPQRGFDYFHERKYLVSDPYPHGRTYIAHRVKRSERLYLVSFDAEGEELFAMRVRGSDDVASLNILAEYSNLDIRGKLGKRIVVGTTEFEGILRRCNQTIRNDMNKQVTKYDMKGKLQPYYVDTTFPNTIRIAVFGGIPVAILGFVMFLLAVITYRAEQQIRLAGLRQPIGEVLLDVENIRERGETL